MLHQLDASESIAIRAFRVPDNSPMQSPCPCFAMSHDVRPHSSVRSVCGKGRVGPRQLMTSLTYGPNGMISQTQTRRNQKLHPGSPSTSQNHNGRAGTAGSLTPGPFSLQFSALDFCDGSPVDDDLVLACPIHTSLHLSSLCVCYLWLHYSGRQSLPPRLRVAPDLSPKVNTIRPF